MSKGRGLLLGQCISPEYTEFIVSLFEGLLEASLLLLTIWLLCTFCPLLRPISRWIWQWEEWGKGLGGNCPLLCWGMFLLCLLSGEFFFFIINGCWILSEAFSAYSTHMSRQWQVQLDSVPQAKCSPRLWALLSFSFIFVSTLLIPEFGLKIEEKRL